MRRICVHAAICIGRTRGKHDEKHGEYPRVSDSPCRSVSFLGSVTSCYARTRVGEVNYKPELRLHSSVTTLQTLVTVKRVNEWLKFISRSPCEIVANTRGRGERELTVRWWRIERGTRNCRNFSMVEMTRKLKRRIFVRDIYVK